MTFVWDTRKSEANFQKHGISFEEASRVFWDINQKEIVDTYDVEQRFRVVGLVDERLLFVVYTIRGDDIRIISARKATRYEREAYFQI